MRAAPRAVTDRTGGHPTRLGDGHAGRSATAPQGRHPAEAVTSPPQGHQEHRGLPRVFSHARTVVPVT